MGAAGAPLVVCLACRANNQARLIEEVLALATALGGMANVHEVTGRTIALHAHLPDDAHARFVSALVLRGALAMSEGQAATSFIVLITVEPDI
jgi:hypothetical protein